MYDSIKAFKKLTLVLLSLLSFTTTINSTQALSSAISLTYIVYCSTILVLSTLIMIISTVKFYATDKAHSPTSSDAWNIFTDILSQSGNFFSKTNEKIEDENVKDGERKGEKKREKKGERTSEISHSTAIYGWRKSFLVRVSSITETLDANSRR